MSMQMPSRPLVTVAYRRSAYDETEIQSVAHILQATADVRLEPLALTLMGGVSELLITVTFGEPLIARRAASPAVADALGEVCCGLAEWYSRLARNRPCCPELVGVRVEGRDMRLDLTCDLSPEACLGAREIRAAARVFREAAPKIASLLAACPARVVAIGIHCDPMTAGGGTCIIGRYWEIFETDDEPLLLVDSWRERIYFRG